LEQELSGLTIEEWLTHLRQSSEAKRSFWYPIAISVMNDLPERASARLFARSLKQAFLGRKSDSRILIPTVGQTELYVNSAVEFIKNHNGKIQTQSEVESIEIDRSKVLGVRLKNGKHCSSKSVISSVPQYALKKILPMKFGKEPPFIHFDKFESSPIVSINLWFDKHFMDMDYVGLISKKLQWVFNRRNILQERNKPTSYISAVISAAYDIVDLSKEELVKIAVHDLQSVFPNVRNAKLLHSVIIKEKRASFSATPEIDTVRPATETPIENFYVAGDWMQTGLPATIEGAILSGVTAAKQIQ
jgi:squalene-associated FAD-dependent desaturase